MIEAFYRVLLRAYPAPFRSRFADEMASSFEAELVDARGSGVLATSLFVVRAAVHALCFGFEERVLRLVTRSRAYGGGPRLTGGHYNQSAAHPPMRRREVFMQTQLLRQTVRRLVNNPGYAFAFVLTLALAIGVNAAIFSVVYGVLLRPLPYADSERILFMKQPVQAAAVENTWFSFIEIDDYRANSSTIDEFVEFGDWDFDVVGLGEPHRAVGGLVTPNYFNVLGLSPQLGRVLTPEDDESGALPVMVLTHEYWTRVVGADPDVIGRTVRLMGKPTTVVGVLWPGSHYTGSRRQDFFVNYATNDHYMGASMRDSRGHRMTDVFARLAPGATLEGARAELEGIADRMHAEYPEDYPPELGYDIAVERWRDELVRDAKPTLLVLMGTVGLVLLLACANLANLTLTRLFRRERELATRAALGAGTGRLRREVLAENFLLAVAGAVLGLVLAVVGLDLLVAYAGRLTVRTGEIGVNPTVLAFTTLLTVGVAVALAWAPGLPIGRHLAASVVSGGTRATVARGRRRIQRSLVAVQLALSFTLLIGAGLLVRSLLRLTEVDPGFETTNLVTLQSPNFGIGGDSLAIAATQRMWSQVVDRVTHYPGVRAAAVAGWAPLSTSTSSPGSYEFRIENRVNDERGARTLAVFNWVSHGYFETTGTPLLEGRTFNTSDNAESPLVVVINETMARTYFPEGGAVGEHMTWRLGAGDFLPLHEIVGVVGDTRDMDIARLPIPTIYRAEPQVYPGQTLLVRTSGGVEPLIQFARTAIREAQPDRVVDEIRTMEDLRDENIAPRRLNATLFGSFAVLALVIAAVGVLGVLAYSVSQRTREFGIRLAVGARQGEVLRMVLVEGVGIAIVALAVGGLAGYGLSRYLATLLYEVEPFDPASVGGAALVLAGVAAMASYLPARRATRVDPMDALRSD